MSLRTFASRTFNARTFNARTWGGSETITAPSAEGWISRPADRVFVASEHTRLSITSPQDRVWIARVDNG